MSVDGCIERPNGELDWAMVEDEETWPDVFDALTVDTFILGRGMYPASRLADQTPHIVVSTTLNKVAWKTTRIVRDVEDLRR
jgi:hypothetical protein